MSIQSLAQKCANGITNYSNLGFPESEAFITITTPKGWKAPPKFPRGEILQVKDNGTRIRCLPAVKVLAWLTANNLVKIEFPLMQNDQ